MTNAQARFRMRGAASAVAGPLAAILLAAGSARADTNFLAGADFSHLAFFESRGVTYRQDGQVQDAIQILKNHGINCVRLRLFTSSQALANSDPYNYINNTNYTVPLAARVKSAGLRLCLDFHYSDSWADPGKQIKPSAWTTLNFTQLVHQMRTYNSNTIATFKAAGAMPDYVQVGNEITPGMLWPDGRISGNIGGTNYDNPTQWLKLRQLMNAAIQGIHQAATSAPAAAPPKIIVHIDRGGDWGGTQWFFGHLTESPEPVQFDIIGQSYYPFYHGSLTSLSNCLRNAAITFGKPIIVAEDAFPWTNSCPASWLSQLQGFPPTPAGQVGFIAAIAKIIKGLPNNRGAGYFYWAAEYRDVPNVNEASFFTASFFDFSGNVLPVAGAVGGMAAPLQIDAFSEGPNVRLQWPFSGAASRLRVATNLGPSTVWSLVTNSVQITGTVFTVTLPKSASPRFYRLQPN